MNYPSSVKNTVTAIKEVLGVWNEAIELIPSWSVVFQGIMIFCVPFILLRAISWAKVKEDRTTTRAKKATGSKGGGVPYGEASGEKASKKDLSSSIARLKLLRMMVQE